jgi:hypothetical protein
MRLDVKLIMYATAKKIQGAKHSLQNRTTPNRYNVQRVTIESAKPIKTTQKKEQTLPRAQENRRTLRANRDDSTGADNAATRGRPPPRTDHRHPLLRSHMLMGYVMAPSSALIPTSPSPLLAGCNISQIRRISTGHNMTRPSYPASFPR